MNRRSAGTLLMKAKHILKYPYALRLPSHFSVWLRDYVVAQSRKIYPVEQHLNAAVDWLCAAHDACDRSGVSALYSFLRGWYPAYPETTGYIIPTLLSCAAYLSRDDLRQRALTMADWEVEIQLPSGAFQGMYWWPKQVGKLEPAIFNTGQVIYGLLSALNFSNNERYAKAIENACQFLAGAQEADGAWRRHLGPNTKRSVYAYNSRVGAVLILASLQLNNKRWQLAGEKNIEWTIKRQRSNGWFADASFTEGLQPLTHTLCYCAEGLLYAGIALSRDEWVARAKLTADSMIDVFEQRGVLPATLDANWSSFDTYQCLTGNCQAALLWFEFFRITQQKRYLKASLTMRDFLMSSQDLFSRNRGIRGGIRGSYPVGGGYVPFAFVNWATKFYMDLLLQFLRADRSPVSLVH